MNEQETRRLLQAARTAVSLIGLVHQVMWELYPDETLLLAENDETRLLNCLAGALKNTTSLDGPKSAA